MITYSLRVCYCDFNVEMTLSRDKNLKTKELLDTMKKLAVEGGHRQAGRQSRRQATEILFVMQTQMGSQ